MTTAAAETLARYGLRPQRPEVIDSSMMKDFLKCESYFYLRHVLGLKKKIFAKAESAKFDWGTCYHKAQEILWHPNGGISKAIQYIDREFPDSIDPSVDRHKRSKERMLRQFLEYYENYFDELSSDYELLRTEQFFDTYSADGSFRWAGRIDKLRRRKRNGKLVIWDYKTSSVMGSHYFSEHEHGFQFPGYVWAMNQSSTEPVEEICLDVMYTLAASHQFFRRTFRYTAIELAEWRHNVSLILDRMHRKLDEDLFDPSAWIQDRTACTDFGLCQFADVHFLPAERDTRLRILSDDYIEDRWDPIHAAEEALLL